ncbi:hypothetical protein M9Y10_030749 [Tritrichomonas musculus]|uniref:Protein kinase domain-containing protein n=1 Tax=Tritrichomonas musculus TaxID=1915356 RepID=A0ABR2H3R4_9EUKA
MNIFYLKICDFSLSVFDNKDIDKEIVGTMVCIAPEVILEEKYSKAVDVYAFAVVVYEIVTHNPPYKRKIGERPKFNDETPESYRRLITKCWQPDPKDRPTFDQIVSILKTDKGFITNDVDKKKF